MTDKEIIKALECCVKGCNSEGCDDCPLYEKVEDCEIEIPIIALDLINRQKAEIERLKGAIVPPVKIGDPIWRIYTWNGEHIVEGKISMIKQKADFTWKFRGIGKGFEGSKDFDVKDIGNLIFLSREEAEKALKEMTEDKP